MNNSYFKLIIFFIISLLLLSPIIIIIYNAIFSLGSFQNLYSTRYVIGSTKIILLVSIFILIISVPLAWINTMTDYPGRKVIQILSILPLGVPAYIAAYTYAELLEPGGYLASLLISFDGFSLRNSFFGSLILSFALFPYVYLLTRIAIINFSARYIEAAKTMGKNSYECFFKICIPMALPGIAAGLALALMETLNDYGVADFFGLQTLTVGVFQYISVINDIPSAYLLSMIILILMLVLYIFEIKIRGKKSFQNSTYEHIQWSRYQLGSIKTILVLSLVSIPIIFGYFIPLVFTLFLLAKNFNQIDLNNYYSSLSNSIVLGIFVGMGCIILSIFINYVSRFSKSNWLNFYKKIINMGYALPGVVIALGVLVFINLFDLYSPILLSTSLFGLILALIIRLISISNNSLQSGLDKIGKSIDDASRLIGRRPSTTYFRIIIPQIKLSILAGFFLVLVDTIKELPITLLLRPFNFNTLATSLYEYSSNEMFELGSLHALTIILFLSAAIYIFDSFLEKKIILKEKK